MGLIKWLVRILLILVVLIGAAIFLVPKFLDPNDYKDKLADIVRKQTGRALVIDGDLKLSVFPWIGVNTNQLTLSQPNHLSRDFGGGNMLDVESAEIRVQTKPLLTSIFADKKDIRIATIKLKKPTVNLITTKKGLSSLDGLTGDSPSPVKGEKANDAASAGAALVVQGVDLSEGTLVWDDRQAGQRYELKDFNLSTGNLLGRSLQKISTSGVFLDSNTPDRMRFSLKGKARIDQDTLEAAAEGLSVAIERGVIKADADLGSLSFVKDGLIQLAEISSDIVFNDPETGPLSAKITSPNALYNQADGLATLSSLVAAGSYKGDPLNANAQTIEFNTNSMKGSLASLNAAGEFESNPFDATVQAADFNLDSMKAALGSLSAKGAYEKEPFAVSSGNLNVDLDSLQGSIVDLALKGGYQGNNIDLTGKSLDFDVNQQALTIKGFAADGVVAKIAELKNLPVKLQGNALKANLSKQTLSLDALSFISQDIKGAVSNIKGKNIIDDPDVSGSIDIDPFNLRALMQQMAIEYVPEKADSLTSVGVNGRFSGGLNSIDLSRLKVKLDDSTIKGDLAVVDFENPNARLDIEIDKLNMDDYLPVSEESAEGEATKGAGALVVPLAVFEQFKANGKLRINSFEGAGLNVKRIAVDVESKNNVTTMKPSAKLYNGSFGGDIKYEKTASGGRLSLKQNLKSINLLGLLTDLDLTDQVSGTGNLGVDLVIEDVNGKQTNRGKVTLGALNGALKGVDIQKILGSASNAYNTLKGRELSDEANYDDETKFAAMGGTFEVNDSKLDNLDFDLKAPLFRVRGEGKIDLAKQVLDYTVKVAVVESLRGQGGASLDKLKGITVPIRFTGDLTSPKYRVDMKALIEGLAGKKINDEIDNAIAKKLGVTGASEKGVDGVLKSAAKNAVSKELEEKHGIKVDSASTKDMFNSFLKKKALEELGLPNEATKTSNEPAPVEPKAEQAKAEEQVIFQEQQPVQKKPVENKPLSSDDLKKRAEEAVKKKIFESIFK